VKIENALIFASNKVEGIFRIQSTLEPGLEQIRLADCVQPLQDDIRRAWEEVMAFDPNRDQQYCVIINSRYCNPDVRGVPFVYVAVDLWVLQENWKLLQTLMKKLTPEEKEVISFFLSARRVDAIQVPRRSILSRVLSLLKVKRTS
jgi:hypothetical protein